METENMPRLVVCAVCLASNYLRPTRPSARTVMVFWYWSRCLVLVVVAMSILLSPCGPVHEHTHTHTHTCSYSHDTWTPPSELLANRSPSPSPYLAVEQQAPSLAPHFPRPLSYLTKCAMPALYARACTSPPSRAVSRCRRLGPLSTLQEDEGVSLGPYLFPCEHTPW